MDFLKRYNAGNYKEVWEELISFGGEVRNPDILPFAQEIARIAMLAVKNNVEELIKRWQTKDYTFGYEWAGKWAEELIKGEPPVLAESPQKEIEALDNFEREYGPIPIVLRSFYEVVGAVNFVGRPINSNYPWPKLDIQLFDPLFVYGFTIDKFTQKELENRLEAQKPMFPDYLGKFFYSGVGAITTKIPSNCFDAILVFEGSPLRYKGKLLYFGDYLREIILSYGGMGLDITYTDKSFIDGFCNGLREF